MTVAEDTWQDVVVRDIDKHTPDTVVEAIVQTSKHLDERDYPAEALAMLKWHGYAFWALPQHMTISDHSLRLINGLYFRSWFCELDGIKIDGHVYTNRGSGCCQACGE